MANLAIRGHKTRGKEVIEILEMLGGENKYQVTAIRETHVYFVDDDNISFLKINQLLPEQFIVFTLEEFLEKYPYKVGDFVRVPEYESEVRIDGMKWDGFEIKYSVSADETEYLYEWYSVEELKPCKEEIMEETNKAIFEGNANCCDIMNDIIKDNIKERKYAELRMPLDDDDKLSTEVTIMDKKILPPNGYLVGKITQTDNGMLVEYVEKKPKYPKTYEKCCGVLGMTYDYPDIQMVSDEEFNLYSNFIQLIRCRNAYWKIAGKEIGLGKPWKPDYIEESLEQGPPIKYVINYTGTHIGKYMKCTPSYILSFPTEEMRDAFYENFKDLIEECKELL